MNKLVRLMGLLPLLLMACASDEELFAKYDAFCNNRICIAQLSEVQYTVAPEIHYAIPAGYTLWEPAVYFGFDKDALTPREIQRLDSDIKVLKDHLEYKVSVRGFTDSFNSQAYNLDLSNRRQNSVVKYLSSKGVNLERVIASKAGELLPIKDSQASKDRILNRRVELLLLDSAGRPLSFGINTDRQISEEETFDPPLPLDRPVKAK